MCRERIQGRIDIGVIGQAACGGAETAQPMRAQVVIGEQAMHIAAGDLAASRSAKGPAPQKRSTTCLAFLP